MHSVQMAYSYKEIRFIQLKSMEIELIAHDAIAEILILLDICVYVCVCDKYIWQKASIKDDRNWIYDIKKNNV